ncbi:MAG: FAD-dependent oxidoreductase [Clostridiales bacterium]|jgi:2,4-dienoyl-CoA reductase (NADPH2)|nr:FAD-dependent oxidoreductase [Clostridiales bacterium]
MPYERLFQPIKIRNLELKNRIIMPAIHLMYNMDGYANERFNEFYWRRAEGGAGLIFVGGCRFDEYGGSPGMMSLQTDDFIPGYRKFTDGMHKRGAKVGVQLYHAGAYAHSIANEGRDALAPSAVFSRFTKEMPKEMTKDEMKEIISKWAEAALRAKKAGFDIVEISASAGYLICQFLSPRTNLRTDEYGGSWENRTRFPLEVIAAIRKAVGDDFPICIRIAGNDFVPGSNTNIEAVMFAKLMEHAGADMINVTGGWHETVIPQLTGDLPRGGFTYLAAAIKDAVSIPVAASNRINDPAVAEKVLAVGEADLVSIGRPLISDPDWPMKAENGEANTIRRCVACNQGCLAKTFFAQPVECLVNGFAGREYEIKERKTNEPKKILVLGAGVAGCEFAIQAAQIGHDVTIWEKSDHIGGQVLLASAIHSKNEFCNIVSYYSAMLEKLNINLTLNKDASLEGIKSAGFDIIVTALGNTPKAVNIPGNSSIPVYTANDIFSGKVIAGKNVVLIGGGAVGCECADYLAYEAALSPEEVYFMLSQHSEDTEKVLGMIDKTRRNIAIVDMVKIGTGFEPGTAWPLMKELNRFGVKQYPFAKILGVTDNSIEIEAVEQKTREQKARERETGISEPDKLIKVSIPCDTIIISAGATPNSELYEALKSDGFNVFNIGDSSQLGKISDAVSQAIELAGKLQ